MTSLNFFRILNNQMLMNFAHRLAIQRLICLTTSIPCSTRFTSTTSDTFRVSDCLFSGITSSSSGGGSIYIANSAANLYLLRSVIQDSSSTTSYSGGGVNFNGNSIFVERCCGLRCLAFDGQLFYTASNLMNIIEISAVYCSSKELGGQYSGMRLACGVQNVTSFNTSNNYVTNSASSIQNIASSSLTIIRGTAYNTTAVGNAVLWFYQETSDVVSEVNVISNNSPYIIQLVSNSNTSMKNCVFAKNTGSVLFAATGTLILYGCFIDLAGLTRTVGSTVSFDASCQFYSATSFAFTSMSLSNAYSYCAFYYASPTRSSAFTNDVSQRTFNYLFLFATPFIVAIVRE